jgi:adenylate cyclase
MICEPPPIANALSWSSRPASAQTDADARTAQNTTQPTRYSLFSEQQNNCFLGVPVQAPSFDADLHVETTTIMFADVVESVRLIEQDELTNVTRIRALLRQLAELDAKKHNGTVLERRGDGLLIKFVDARSAAACAFDIHNSASTFSRGASPSNAIALRIGIHRASLYNDGDSNFGVGLSHAARIAAMALPNQTLLSEQARDEVVDGLDASIRDVGNFYGKNMPTPLRLFEVIPLGMREPAVGVPKREEPTHTTLAVLPLDHLRIGISFNSLVACSVGDVFADLATQAFSRSTGIKVISRLSCRAAASGARDSQNLLKNLGADYVLSGTWRENGQDSFLFGLELMSCKENAVVWAEESNVSASDLLRRQSEYVAGIVSSVVAQLAAAEIEKTEASPLPTIASHTLVLSSIALMHRVSRADFESAHRVIETVVERAPRHAVPRAWLARWHTFRVVQGWAAADQSDQAEAVRQCELALALDPDQSLVHAVAGSVSMSVRRDLPTAFKHYAVALALNPNDSLAWALLAAAHALNDDGQPALAAAMRALELSPLDPMRFLHESLAASACLTLGDYAEARRWAETSIRANRAHFSTIRVAAIACQLQGDHAAAKQFITELQRELPTYSVASFLGANPHAKVSENRLRFADALQAAGLPSQ